MTLLWAGLGCHLVQRLFSAQISVCLVPVKEAGGLLATNLPTPNHVGTPTVARGLSRAGLMVASGLNGEKWGEINLFQDAFVDFLLPH